MVKEGEKIKVSLVPKNEAEYPEIVEVEILKLMPLKQKQSYIAKLLMAPKQDFGYYVGELVLVEVVHEEGKFFAFCERALEKELSHDAT